MLPLHPIVGLLPQHFFEQDSFVGHVLIDNPQAVASGRDDEAVVDLAERPQVRKDPETLRSLDLARQWAVRIRDWLRSDALEVETGFRGGGRFQMEHRKIFGALWSSR